MNYIISQSLTLAVKSELVDDFYVDEHYSEKGVAVIATASGKTYILGTYDTKEQAVEIIKYLAFTLNKARSLPIIIPSAKDAEQFLVKMGKPGAFPEKSVNIPSLDDILNDFFGGGGK